MSQFVDRVVLHLTAGDGGHGANSVHREKFKPLGGPDGGNGGHGGDIILEVSQQVHTLLDLHFHPHLKAQRGGNGAGNWRNGPRGEDLILEVPVGTVVLDDDGSVLADLTEVGTRFAAAQGGFGGLGNAALANATRKAPGFALKGEPGEQKDLVLELKSMADVGLLGFPSAGKSSLISVVSQAKPKIGDYPFTTLQPNLGVVSVGHDTFTMADVPGLIPGASAGKGLGLDFLRHIERCAVLVHVVDCATLEPDRDPISDIQALESELDKYQSVLSSDVGLGDLQQRPRVIVLNKVDIPDAAELAEFLRPELEETFPWPIFEVSTVTRQGLQPLLYSLLETVQEARRARPKKRQEHKHTIIRPRAVDKRDFAVESLGEGEWEVVGDKPQRWINQTDFENDEAVGYLADRLRKLGVEEALRKQGAREGDTVFIGPISFEWDPMAGGDEDFVPSNRGTDDRLYTTQRASAEERKRASQARRGLIDEYDFGQSADTQRWEG